MSNTNLVILLFCLIKCSTNNDQGSTHKIGKYYYSRRSHNLVDPNPEKSIIIPNGCKTECTTDFNTVLGSNNNVIGYSNCNATFCTNFDDGAVMIKKEALGTSEDIFSGIRWQCVEYARRWLIIIKRYTFDSIDNAYQIWDLNTVTNIDTNEKVNFISYNNDSSSFPKYGDLIIFDKDPNNPYGHVAVVVDVNLEEGYVDLAEQNNLNDYWEDINNYSRRLKLLNKTDGSLEKFYLTESSIEEYEYKSRCLNGNTNESSINCYFENSSVNLIIGWKRIEEYQ